MQLSIVNVIPFGGSMKRLRSVQLRFRVFRLRSKSCFAKYKILRIIKANCKDSRRRRQLMFRKTRVKVGWLNNRLNQNANAN